MPQPGRLAAERRARPRGAVVPERASSASVLDGKTHTKKTSPSRRSQIAQTIPFGARQPRRPSSAIGEPNGGSARLFGRIIAPSPFLPSWASLQDGERGLHIHPGHAEAKTLATCRCESGLCQAFAAANPSRRPGHSSRAASAPTHHTGSRHRLADTPRSPGRNSQAGSGMSPASASHMGNRSPNRSWQRRTVPRWAGVRSLRPPGARCAGSARRGSTRCRSRVRPGLAAHACPRGLRAGRCDTAMRELSCDGVFAYWRVGEGAVRWCKAWCGGAWRAAPARPPGRRAQLERQHRRAIPGEPAGVASPPSLGRGRAASAATGA